MFISLNVYISNIIYAYIIKIYSKKHSWTEARNKLLTAVVFFFLFFLVYCPVPPPACLLQERSETSPRPAPRQSEPDQEELDFMFDEEMEQLAPRKNQFTDWSDDEDSDYELDDQDVNKILIVTQTPPHLRKHPGGDRTGNHESRARITSDLAKAINDGLYYYEQDLWKGEEPVEGVKVSQRKVIQI